MTTKKYNPQQTRETIIAVSTKLFSEKGYDETSMQDIVAALGMSKGAIFYHFKSKEDIFHVVMERQFEDILNAVNQWLIEMDGLTGKEKLRGMVKQNLMDEQAIMESRNMITSAVGSPHLKLAFIQNTLKKLAPIVANVFREGVEDGSIVTEFPEECAEVFLLLLNFWCDTEIFQGNFPTLHMRFRFIQHLMRELGVDIIEDETIEAIDQFYQKETKENKD